LTGTISGIYTKQIPRELCGICRLLTFVDCFYPIKAGNGATVTFSLEFFLCVASVSLSPYAYFVAITNTPFQSSGGGLIWYRLARCV
jgi:hypothetical protein